MGAKSREIERHRSDVQRKARSMLRRAGATHVKLLGAGNIGAVFAVPGREVMALVRTSARQDKRPLARAAPLTRAFQTNEVVAVKVQLVNTRLPGLRSDAPHEAAAMRKLSEDPVAGPHVPEFMYGGAVQTRGDTFYVIVMERVVGTPMYKMARIPPMLWDELERAVQRVHAAGFAHTDLHGGNVVFTPTHQAKLIDFGMARLATRDSMAINLKGVREMRAEEASKPAPPPPRTRVRRAPVPRRR